MRKIIVFHGARCGAGQSTLVANVAFKLALDGKRVAVIDADLFSPGQHVIFNWQRKPDQPVLNTYLNGKASLREVTHRLTHPLQINIGARLRLGGELFLVPADQTIDAMHEVWETGYDLDLLYHSLPRLIEGLMLDYVLVDTHPGMDPNSMLIASAAELLYIVSSTDRQCMDSTEYLLFALQRRADTPSFLIINKIIESRNAQELRSSIKSRFDIETAAILPWEREVARQLDDSPLAVLRQPDGSWQRGLNLLVDHLNRESARPAWDSDLDDGYQ
jgi:septum site-determining protein MinD